MKLIRRQSKPQRLNAESLESSKKLSPPSSVPIAKPLLFGEEDLVKRFDVELISNAVKEEQEGGKERLTLSIWDYGGQQVFYALHHIFLTQYGIYCVVFNMAEIVGPSSTERSREDALSLLLFWLRSIKMHAEKAPVVLAGTHKDQIQSVSMHKDINKLLDEKLELNLNPQILPYYYDRSQYLYFFPIDNAKGLTHDPVIAQLKETIIDAVKDKDYVKNNVPITWMRALDLYFEKRNTKIAHLEVLAATNIALSAGVTETQITYMLNFFHQLGALCYFDSCPELQNLLILDPQWIVDNLTKIIRDFDLHRHEMLQDFNFKVEYAKDYENLKRKGVLSKRLLQVLWKDESQVEQDFLLSLMKNMSLLSPWSAKGDKTNIQYLVPSLVTSLASPEDERIILEQVPEAVFDLNFQAFFLPFGLFARLVALIVSHASDMFDVSCEPILSNTKALLSFGFAVFTLENLYEQNIIRVGVVSKGDVYLVRTWIVSMVEKLREEVMGKSLKWNVVFHVEVSSRKLKVSYDKILESQEKKQKQVFSMERIPVPLSSISWFLEEPSKREDDDQALQTLDKMRNFLYHIFISYYQANAIDQVATLTELLKQKNLKVWFDQGVAEITEQAMIDGVTNSAFVLIFLSKDILTRPFCLMEIRKAIELVKKVLLVYEEDPRSPGKVDFSQLKLEAPDDIRTLLNNIESIPYRRRQFERNAMLKELERRITKLQNQVTE